MEIQDGLESQVKFVIRSAAKPCGHAHAPFESIPGSNPCKSLTPYREDQPMAIKATVSAAGLLSEIGDGVDNTMVTSRDAGGWTTFCERRRRTLGQSYSRRQHQG
jgi:hypothetical protein